MQNYKKEISIEVSSEDKKDFHFDHIILIIYKKNYQFFPLSKTCLQTKLILSQKKYC